MSVCDKAISSITVLEVNGSFFGDEETEDLARAITAATSGGTQHLILDLARCKVMNSTALSVLTQAHRDCEARGGTVRLCGISKRIEDLLTLTRVLHLFRLYPTVDRALASFAEAESESAA